MDCGGGVSCDRRFDVLNLVDKMINTFAQSRIAERAAERVSSMVSSEPLLALMVKIFILTL